MTHIADQLQRVASDIRDASAHNRSVALMKWLSKQAKRLSVAEHVYVVGGAIRNWLIDKPIKDVDVVIDAVAAKRDSEWLAKQLQNAMPAYSNLTTNQYGVAILTVKGSWILDGQELEGEVIEIANARKESYGHPEGKGHKPQVSPTTIEEDVYRREFTFNTLMWRLLDLAHGPEKAEIIDLTGCGRRDLEKGVLRCPRDPDTVFSDDPTRLMRVIKFVAKYGFKIPPDVAASIKRNAHLMKRPAWEAIGTILVDNVLKEPTARDALKLMDKLGLLEVVSEMVQENKPFATYLAGQIKNKDVQLLLDLMDLGVPVRTPLDFLDPKQRQLVREITTGMESDVADDFVSALKKPPLDNRALISEFDLAPHERGVLAPTARGLMLADPDLAFQPSKLQREMGRVLR